jgi:hypothetical protein
MSMGENNEQEHDQVLLDYLDTLLQDDVAEGSLQSTGKDLQQIQQMDLDTTQNTPVVAAFSYPLMGLRVQIAGCDLVLPIAGLAGMQALTGPLLRSGEVEGLASWKVNLHADLAMLDASHGLDRSVPTYEDAQWRGHVLKLKGQAYGLLVNDIKGPFSVSAEQVDKILELTPQVTLLLLK